MSLITTSSLHRFEELAPGSRFDPRRFRMNLVLETGAPGLVENGWLEHRLTIGEQASLTVTLPDSRCVMITLPQEDLPEDRAIMRTLMEHNRLDIGETTARPCAGRVRRRHCGRCDRGRRPGDPGLNYQVKGPGTRSAPGHQVSACSWTCRFPSSPWP